MRPRRRLPPALAATGSPARLRRASRPAATRALPPGLRASSAGRKGAAGASWVPGTRQPCLRNPFPSSTPRSGTPAPHERHTVGTGHCISALAITFDAREGTTRVPLLFPAPAQRDGGERRGATRRRVLRRVRVRRGWVPAGPGLAPLHRVHKLLDEAAVRHDEDARRRRGPAASGREHSVLSHDPAAAAARGGGEAGFACYWLFRRGRGRRRGQKARLPRKRSARASTSSQLSPPGARYCRGSTPTVRAAASEVPYGRPSNSPHDCGAGLRGAGGGR